MTRRIDVIDLVLTAVEENHSAVIGGAMGVGKSHLLDVVAGRLRDDGRIVTMIRANPAAATIPFGALSAFVAGGEGVGRLAMLQDGVATLAGLAAGRPHVIAVDDAPMLDDQSVAVLHQLSDEHDVSIIATARTSDTESPALRSLWRQCGAERVELGPLEVDEAVVIAEEQIGAMGASIEAEAVAEIARRAEGNPLFLTELARAHVQGSTLTPQLRELVAGRIDGLDPELRRQLRFVAVADPLDVALDVADSALLNDLEVAGLIRTHDEESFLLARPAHPLFGEVVRDELSALKRREFARELSDSMGRRPITRRGDALRLAGWLRTCGDRPAPELAAAAAIEAVGWLEVDLANELADIGVSDGPSFTTLFAAGEIARLTGDTDRALEVWTEAFDLAEADADIRRVAMALAQVYGWFCNRPDDAVLILERGSDRMVDPAQRLECQSERALFAALLGRYEEVVTTASSVLEHPDASADARWTALTNLTWAEAQLVQLTRCDERFDMARDLLHVVDRERMGEIDLLYGVIVCTRLQQGELDEALAAFAETAGAGRPTGATMFCAAQVHLCRGDLGAALAAAADGVNQLDSYDPFNSRPLALSMLSMCQSMSGDADLAAATLATAVEDAVDVNGVWERIWFARAKAWQAAATGDFDTAIEHLQESVEACMTTGHRGWGFFIMIDLAGWMSTSSPAAASALAQFAGHALEWIDGLEAAPYTEELLTTMISIRDHDIGRLDESIASFEKMGTVWQAALAFGSSALLVSDAADACRRATAAMLFTPWAATLRPEIRDLALSERQSAVVRQAAAGESSKAIAESLFLSVRTVDNHLQASYKRLGVSSRAGLAELFPS